MPETQLDFISLMARVESGDAEAERELIDRFGSHILRIVRRRLDEKIRPQFDSQDFCQAVWASFFAHRNELGRFKSDSELLAFLGGMAGHKVIDEIRRRLIGKKWNVNLECSLENSVAPLPSKAATPSEVAVANERIQWLIDGRPELHRRILELRAAGATYKDIAGQIGMNERNVRKVIERIEKQMGK